MNCDSVRTRLTAYLDGDLDPDRGTVVRGHLRTCDACRKVAEQEAVLRDELRSLPTLDPPPSMWGNIQAQLAAVEVEESKRPAWKRAVSRWIPMLPRFAMGGVLAAAAVGILYWRTHQGDEPTTKVVDLPSQKIEAAAPKKVASTSSCNLDAPAGTDVTEDLATEAARVTACYEQTANELLVLANEARATWSTDQQTAFDAEIKELRAAIDAVPKEDGRGKQRALRSMNRYLQNALTRRDQVALASAGGTP